MSKKAAATTTVSRPHEPNYPAFDVNVALVVGDDCSCCDNDSCEEKPEQTHEELALGLKSTPVKTCGGSGLRKRTSAKSSSSPPTPKEACGEHRNIVRSRYNDTLSAFGCVCKALLARGVKSRCTPTPGGKAVTRPASSKNSARLSIPKRASVDSCRPPSVDSCCGKSDCGGEASGVRKVPQCGGRKGASSAKTRSCASLISDCEDSCCDGGSDKKNDDAAIDLAERGAGAYNEHVVLAIKGMT